jgi:transcriptional regulator with XRE-family HTH domain
VDTKEFFAARLRQLRESRGMGVRELADKIGISHPAISQYENLKREPNTSICAQFAKYFNVSSDYLLGLTDDPRRKE